ncbi:MAG: alpha/beta hydrolase [Ardenticatenaceae bacterium]|nr:alpha/beta hydrolase [Anaerolineales bacterium]MCB8921254.1 alpha/beta hydrolase [Ardenticatenaceae bacterium]MCB8990620.1 alpha/beta hydrolase [Ardenticatenaceae bacterium]MCB9004327.1 alpha/beta hydrolase [Ardenticatenaceae bacterium]
MTSLQFQAILQLLQNSPDPASVPLTERRATADALAAQTPLLDGVYTEEMGISAKGHTIPALLVAAQSARDDRLILYFHGGGYALGSIATHRDLACRLSAVSGARVLLVDYRLAPEHPFPAAVEDGTAVYHYLLQNGYTPDQLIIGGESAGGGLTLAVLLALRDGGHPLPAAAFALSPWVDLALTGDSLHRNAANDPGLTLAHLQEFASWYLGETDPQTPLASPLYANLSGLPPLLIQVGTAEILLDDARRLAAHAETVSVSVTRDEHEGMIHGWQGFAAFLPEAFEALENVGNFVASNQSPVN